MSHFIPKKTLTEGMAANPLDYQVSNDQDVTKLAQEGILTAIAAETDAINQYTQIADLIFQSESWFKEKATPVIDDIVAEEKKHLGQLTEFISNLPAFEKEIKDGKEETETGKHKEESITESVKEKTNEPFGKFDSDIIFDLLENKYNVDLTDDFVSNYPLEMYAGEVDDMLAELQIDPNVLPTIESDIIENADIEKNKKRQQEEDDLENLQYDISVLEKLIDPDNTDYIRTESVRMKIYDILSDLRISLDSKKNQ